MSLSQKESHRSFGGTQAVYTHHSVAVSGEMEFSLYLPPQAEEKSVPLLIYLSGLTCTQDNVTTKSGFQQFAARHGFAVLCPDTSPRGSSYPGEHDDYDFGSGAGFYVNATRTPWSDTYRMFDYVSEELPRLIADHFPADMGRVGIFGHSMGGHGALIIGLRHPELFKSISAFAPISSPSNVPWGRKALSGYLGEEERYWEEYDANRLIQAGPRCAHEILIDQGSADPFLQEQLQPWIFESSCKEAGQPLKSRMQDGYDHSYYFISSFMQDHFQHHADILAGED